MIQSQNGRLTTNAIPVEDLVTDVRAGIIRIPAFQRGLRWQQSDVIKLFDSIVRGYPIGNLLLWQRSAAEVPNLKIGAIEIHAPARENALFVVDGQQRLISLANALTEAGHKDPRFALAYDLEKQTFVKADRKSRFQLPLPTLFDLTRLLRWFGDNPDLVDEPKYVERANRVAKAVREFKVPVYVVEQSDENVLRDIFDRMNNYGKQLTRSEVFSALHEAETGERSDQSGRHELSTIAMEIHAATGFGVVDDNTILLAILARRGADLQRDVRREFGESAPSGITHGSSEFSGESADESRRRATVALLDAVGFIQNEAGLPHFAFLPYRFLLVVLTRFFAHFPSPSHAARRNLRRLFWRAASLGPEFTNGNISYATRALCARIIPGDERQSIEGLLKLVGDRAPRELDRSEFKTNYAATRLMLSAMWDLSPMRLDSLDSPRRFLVEDVLASLGESNSPLNITPTIIGPRILTSPLRGLAANRLVLPELEGQGPESVLESLRQLSMDATGTSIQLFDPRVATSILASHGVSAEAAAALVESRYEDFLNLRQDDLDKALRSYLSRQAEWNFEDTPSLDDLDLDAVEDVSSDEDPARELSN